MNTESVAEFRARAGSWLPENMPKIYPANPVVLERDSEETWKRARELQRRLYDGGFAGFCFPREPAAVCHSTRCDATVREEEAIDRSIARHQRVQ